MLIFFSEYIRRVESNENKFIFILVSLFLSVILSKHRHVHVTSGTKDIHSIALLALRMCQELVPMPIQLIKNINVILASCHTVLSPHFFFESFIWYSLICSCWRYRISYQISFIRNVKNLFWPAHVLYLPQSWAFPSRFISPLYSLPTQPPLQHPFIIFKVAFLLLVKGDPILCILWNSV